MNHGLCFSIVFTKIISVRNVSNPKPATGGSARGARRSSRARSRKISCQQNYSPGKQNSTVPSKASKTRRLNTSRERTGEILFKPTEEQNQRLTSDLSAVYQRFISETSSALCFWMPNRRTTHFSLCKPFSRTCLA